MSAKFVFIVKHAETHINCVNIVYSSVHVMVCMLCTRDDVYYHAGINNEHFGRIFTHSMNE